jgi:hypothetical protein
MKRLLLAVALVIGMVTASCAQSATLMPLIAGDTVVNAGTVTKTFTATAGYSAIGVQPVITKISGTVAGTAILYYSLDGTNYLPAGDTLTLANVTTNTALFAKVTAPAVYYRIVVTGSGTMSAQVRLYHVERKYSN